MIALTVSATRDARISGGRLGVRDVISVAEDSELEIGLVESEGGRRSSNPLMMVRESGAGFCCGEY